MITIEVKNPEEVIRRRKGWLISKVGFKLLDFEDKVEKELMVQLKESLSKEGIEVDIKQIKE